MKNSILLILTILLASASSFAQIDRSKQPEPGPAPKINMERPIEFSLDNGLNVMIVENHKLPRVSLSLFFDRTPFLMKEKGFFKFENALTGEFINNIISDVKTADIGLNKNNVAGVYFTHGNQFFLTHMLAASKSFYNYCTNSKVIKFCKEMFGDLFRLKALRYYENFGGQHMQWHTDNRRYEKSKSVETHTTDPGIIFLAYLSDVEDGEFQYIQKSHIWSGQNTHHDYTVDYVNQNYKILLAVDDSPGTAKALKYGVRVAQAFNNKVNILTVSENENFEQGYKNASAKAEKMMRRSGVNAEVLFKVGDPVKVTDGPFMDFSGYVQEVNHDKQKLKVLVSILEDKLLLS